MNGKNSDVPLINYSTSEIGISLIKRFEGLELKAYKDVAGIWTIGYGHTALFKGASPQFTASSIITPEEAENLLINDLYTREQALNKWLFNHNISYINQNMFDALISFIFNVGFAAFVGSSIAKGLKRNDIRMASEAFLLWNKARIKGKLQPVAGLTKRREAEKQLFLEPMDNRIGAKNTATAKPENEKFDILFIVKRFWGIIFP